MLIHELKIGSKPIPMPEGWDERGRITLVDRKGRNIFIVIHPDMPPKKLNFITLEWEDL